VVLVAEAAVVVVLPMAHKTKITDSLEAVAVVVVVSPEYFLLLPLERL
jgi:hypothetical protein